MEETIPAAEGTIVALRHAGNGGTIRPDDGGAPRDFAAGDVQGVEFAALRVGQAVTYEPVAEARAVAVRPASAVAGD